VNRAIFAAFLAITGCGGGASDPCPAALTASFEQVPNGPLPGTPIGGLELTSLGGSSVAVLRDGSTMPPTPALLITQGGRVIIRPRCDARSLELAFDDSEARLSIELYPGDDGGSFADAGGEPVGFRTESGALTTTPDSASGYRRATVQFPNGGKIRRVEITAITGSPTMGGLIRVITLAP